jgi:hypothetical protein
MKGTSVHLDPLSEPSSPTCVGRPHRSAQRCLACVLRSPRPTRASGCPWPAPVRHTSALSRFGCSDRRTCSPSTPGPPHVIIHGPHAAPDPDILSFTQPTRMTGFRERSLSAREGHTDLFILRRQYLSQPGFSLVSRGRSKCRQRCPFSWIPGFFAIGPEPAAASGADLWRQGPRSCSRSPSYPPPLLYSQGSGPLPRPPLQPQ